MEMVEREGLVGVLRLRGGKQERAWGMGKLKQDRMMERPSNERVFVNERE
jgi:hypothetical protein